MGSTSLLPGSLARGARERLNALSFSRLGPVDPHCPMPRAQRRADIVHPLGRNAQGIAAAFAPALGFQEPRLLFFRLIGRPVVAPTLDVETGMRKSAEAFGDLDQARAKSWFGRAWRILPSRPILIAASR